MGQTDAAPDTGSLVGMAQGARGTPLIKWAGGKRGSLRVLLALAPSTFETYYEPFLGGASYFLALGPRKAVLADANAELVELYKTVRDEPRPLMQALEALRPKVSDADFYYRLRATPLESLTPVERAARFIFLNKTGYNGLYRVNRRGQFNVPFGRHASPPQLYEATNLEAVSNLLKRAELRQSDFEDVLDSASRADFAYLDPPYVPLSASANFTGYTANSFNEQDQRRLAAAVRRAVERGVYVLVSNSESPLVRELYGAYEIHIVTTGRAINSDATKRGKIKELAIVGRSRR